MRIFEYIKDTLFPSQNKGQGESSQKDFINMSISELQALTEHETLSKDLSDNINKIKKYHGNSHGLVVRDFKTGSKGDINGAAVYIDGMTDDVLVGEVLRTLLIDVYKVKYVDDKRYLSFLKDQLLVVSEISEVDKINAMFEKLLSGDMLLLIDGYAKALALDTKGWKSRAIEESEGESTLRGARDAFIEVFNDNLALLRRRIKIPQLWVEKFEIGNLSKTKVALVYIKGLCGEEILEEVRSRLNNIDIDFIGESGKIEEFIEDTPYTLFPVMNRTERPDEVVAKLFEGQFSLIVDGTPFVVTAPITLFELLHSPEDNYEKPFIGSIVRILRYIATVISTFLPGFYVAVVNYHPELIPTDLFLRISASREGIPFPVIVELLLMEFVFEVLREAGARLPSSMGTAISIVGALVLGDAAIQASIVSPAMVIVVAFTAITSFVVPNLAFGIAARILRFVFVALGAVFGLFGIQIGTLILIIHLCGLRSFGVPYLYPVAPLVVEDLKDGFIRIWHGHLHRRPKLTGFKEIYKKASGQKRGGS